jgi:hypothetical protein
LPRPSWQSWPGTVRSARPQAVMSGGMYAAVRRRAGPTSDRIGLPTLLHPLSCSDSLRQRLETQRKCWQRMLNGALISPARAGYRARRPASGRRLQIRSVFDNVGRKYARRSHDRFRRSSSALVWTSCSVRPRKPATSGKGRPRASESFKKDRSLASHGLPACWCLPTWIECTSLRLPIRFVHFQ